MNNRNTLRFCQIHSVSLVLKISVLFFNEMKWRSLFVYTFKYNSFSVDFFEWCNIPDE